MNTDTHTTSATPVTPRQLLTRGTNVDGDYTFMPYSPKAPVTAPQGYRVAKVMYKTNTKTGTIAGENSCVIVPVIESEVVTANMDRLTKHVINMLEAEQDKIVKGIHTSTDNEVVDRNAITLDAIITALEAESVSGRLNKEQIEQWFTAHVQDNLAILFADKLGCELTALDAPNSKLSLTVKVYKDMLSKLASNTTVYQPEQAEKLLQAVNVTCEDEASKQDVVTIKLTDKLNKMIKPVNAEELLGLL